MHPLDWDATQWSAFGIVVTAGIAFVAALFAGWQLLESRRLREAQAQPFVVVSIESSEADMSFLSLSIQNIGQTLARDVMFEFDPPLQSKLWNEDPTRDLNGSVFMKRGFASMPPGMLVERFFENMTNRDPSDNLPWTFEVTVRFSDYRGKRQKPLTYVIDLLPLTSGSKLVIYTTHHVAKRIDELRKMIATELKSVRKSIDHISETEGGREAPTFGEVAMLNRESQH